MTFLKTSALALCLCIATPLTAIAEEAKKSPKHDFFEAIISMIDAKQPAGSTAFFYMTDNDNNPTEETMTVVLESWQNIQHPNGHHCFNAEVSYGSQNSATEGHISIETQCKIGDEWRPIDEVDKILFVNADTTVVENDQKN